MALTNAQKVELYAGVKGESPAFFSDDELEEFLDRAGSDILLAASYAALAASGKHALIAQRLKTGEWEQDGTKTPEAFRKLAADLLKQSQEAPAIAVAERNVSIFSPEEIALNRAMRAQA